MYYISAPEERVSIYYHNNPKLQELIDDLLQKEYASKTQALSILISLHKLKDPSVKKVLNKQLVKAFISRDLKLLHYFSKHYTYHNLSEEERKSLYYDNNKKIREMIDTALKYLETSLNFGIPMLLKLITIQDQSARKMFKETIKKLIFCGDNSIIDSLLKKFNSNIKILFDYKELKELYKDPHSPTQLKEFLNRYFEIHKELYGFTREKIERREDILEKSYFPNNEIPNSDFFIIFFRSKRNKAPYSIKPIYNNAVKKIVINYARISEKEVSERIEELKSKYKLLYEFNVSKIVDNSVLVRVCEIYFLSSNGLTNKEIRDIFNSNRENVKISIIELN